MRTVANTGTLNALSAARGAQVQPGSIAGVTRKSEIPNPKSRDFGFGIFDLRAGCRGGERLDLDARLPGGLVTSRIERNLDS